MTIVQITDLHIGGEGQATFQTDVRGNFRNILGLLSALKPDHVVLTGDICFHDPEASIYRWVREQVDQLNIPYDFISGNHDDPVTMAESFGRRDLLRDGELYFVRSWQDWTVLFLDTTRGLVSESQLLWLSQHLEAAQRKELIIFMHHPPLFGGVPHMDRKYPLINRAAVQKVLFGHGRPIHVFCGHYHVDKIVHQENVTVHITPSCFFQIDQHTSAFAVDHRRPGMRIITLNGERLMSSVKYATELPLADD